MNKTADIEKSGIFNLSAEEYHSDPCKRPSLSSSIAKLLLTQSPAHAWHASPRLNPNWEPKNNKVFDIGRAAHTLILGKGEGFAVYPPELLSANGAVSTKAAKEWEADQRANGITPIKRDQEEKLSSMFDVVHSALSQLGVSIDPADSEITAIAEIDGVMCRCMVDNAPTFEVQKFGKVLIDFKTCSDASLSTVTRSIVNYGYDLQARHYQEVWKAATGEERDFLFVFQEKEAPFEVQVVKLLYNKGHSGDWLETAQDKVQYARFLWGQHLRTDDWPGYPRLVAEIGAPHFYAQSWEDKRDRDETVSAHVLAASRTFQQPESIKQ